MASGPTATNERRADGPPGAEVTLARLFRSPLALRITLAVFVSILIVEALILFPSYARQEAHLLEDLRDVGTQWIVAAEATHAGAGGPRAYAETILHAPLVAGVALFGADGAPIAAAGEAVTDVLPRAGSAVTSSRTRDGSRYEAIWSGAETPVGSTIVLRMDSAEVDAELRAFVLRIVGLAVIVTAALTAATMVAMGAVVLRPLVALRLALAHGTDVNWSRRQASHARRKDEIGEVFRATAALLDQLGAARRDLEERVDARTAELRQLNVRLLESEKRFRDLADASSDFYWEMDADLRFSFLSDRFTDVTGVPGKWLLGKRQEEAPIPGLDPEVWRLHLEGMANHEPFRDFTHTRIRRDGTTAHVTISGRPIFDADGRFAGYRGIGADVTEAKRAERELADKEALLRLALDNMTDGIYVLDSDLRYLTFNDRYFELLGVNYPEIAIGRPVADAVLRMAEAGFYGPGDPKDLVNARVAMLASDEYAEIEVETPANRIMHVRKSPLETGGAVVTLTDITERKRAEQATRESEERLQTVLDHMPAAVFFRDPRGRFVFINRAYERTYGLQRDAVVGRTLHELFPPEDAESCVAITQDVLDSGTVVSREYESTVGDGGMVFSTVMFPIHDASGAVAGVGGVELDITERKRAERALLESQLRMRSLIDNSPSEIVIKDPDLRYIQVNRIFEEHYGVTRDEIAGRRVRDVLPESMARAIEVQDTEVMRSGVPIEMELEAPIHGEIRINLESKFPIPDDDGNVIGIGGIATDITERKRAERELEQAKEAADAANKAKGDLVAMVSHEIRTPMNGALGMARLLWETDLDAYQRECAGTIVASGEALVRIVDDLLDVSKLEVGALELETIPFIPGDVVEQSVGVMAARADEKGLTLRLAIDPAIPPVLIGDPLRLRQILLNLISNAIKFTAKGSVSVEATLIDDDGDAARVRFAVADTGQGIRPATQKKLFAPYTQGTVEVARRYGGTGLGLTICRRLAELMGSEIVVDSGYGKGSTFHLDVSLSVDRTTDAVALREAQANQVLGHWDDAASGRPLRVLQVEDNAVNRSVVEKMLSRVGHTVVSVEDGSEALEAIRDGRFDVVIMDRHMPGMGGIEATRRIRAMDPPLGTIPIIGVTAAAGEDDLNACLQAGMDTVLAKPLRTKDVRMLVTRLATPSAETPGFRADATVLVVDDMEINLSVAERQLEKLGLASELEASGLRALDRVKRGRYDAVLIDVSMPELDGAEFTRRLRRWEADRGRHTPVIAMTGHASRQDRARFIEAGMDDYIAKPVVLRDLGAVLGKWLGAPGGGRRPDPTGPETGEVDGADVRPPVDMDLLSEILDEDDEDERLDWVRQFLAEAPALLEALAAAIAGEDREATRDAAHAAKSAASCAAAMPLSDLLQRLETAAGSAAWSDIAAAADAVKAELDRVAAFGDARSVRT